MNTFEETITLTGTTFEDVAVVVTLESQDGITLSELAAKVRAFVRAFGYDYVEDVIFETDTGVKHGCDS